MDTLTGSVAMFILGIGTDTISKSFLTMLLLNSVSLVVIIIILIIRRLSGLKNTYSISEKYMPLFILGGLSLALYITSIQISCFNDRKQSIKDFATIALSVSSVVFIVICIMLLMKQSENEHLKNQTTILNKMQKMQKDYYTSLLQKELETKRFRHDIKNHIYCMNILLKNKNYDELSVYLSEIASLLPEIKQNYSTGNTIVNFIVNEISSKYQDVSLNWYGIMSDDMNISSMHLCTVFSNLLNNAFEHAETTSRKQVWVKVRNLESNLLVSISNYISNEPVIVNGEIVTSKQEAGHGYGLKNVKMCMESIGGYFDISINNGCFTAEVIFTDAVPVFDSICHR